VRLATVLVFLAASTSAAAEDPAAALASIRPEALRSHVRFLADDLLEGRDTASRGHEIAARFVAAQFEELGLEPSGGGGSYLQRVPLKQARILERGTFFLLNVPGRSPRSLVLGKDFVALPSLLYEHADVLARAVYVGHGISAPEMHHDDYEGVDVRGKVVVILFGAPPTFPNDQRAYYSSTELKNKEAAARGAVAILSLIPPEEETRRSFARLASNRDRVSMAWIEGGLPAGVPAGLRARVALSRVVGEEFFEGTRLTADEAFRAAGEGRTGSLELQATVHLHVESRGGVAESPNVLGVLKGSDPELSKECVVLSAHLDHLGIGAPRNGHAIYHGAYDNASGVAGMMEIARALATTLPRPRRSILFAAFTGEEKGLLGSDYFAHHPTVPLSAVVADLNMDMFLTLYPVKDIVAFGAEHSSLGPLTGEMAARLGLEVSPDPSPQEVIFIRSDHYAFVKQGIPSLMLSCGLKTTDPTIDSAKLFRNWMATVYHSPQDDMTQPMDFESAARIARLYLLVALGVANDPQRPSWNEGDFFGGRFAH